MRAASLVLLVALAIAAGAGAGAASAAGGQVAHHEIIAGSRGANLPGERLRDVGRVLRSRGEATRVLGKWGLDRAAVKGVDFSRHSLIVVLANYRPSAGYRARVASVVVRGRETVVTADVRFEAAGKLVAQDLERPWVVVAVKRAAVARVNPEVRVRTRGAAPAR
ncbi:MAG TPA: hypothetical protein VL120_19045 [Solirubrobacteraceae bacterium]|jgi:hypothetical protein|nr:hypothetical protein [Solirubrobacteraceae bacterium]